MKLLLSVAIATCTFGSNLPQLSRLGTRSVTFEPNQGQVPGKTEWIAQAASGAAFLTSTEVVLALMPERRAGSTRNVHVRMIGAKERVTGTGEQSTCAY